MIDLTVELLINQLVNKKLLSSYFDNQSFVFFLKQKHQKCAGCRFSNVRLFSVIHDSKLNIFKYYINKTINRENNWQINPIVKVSKPVAALLDCTLPSVNVVFLTFPNMSSCLSEGCLLSWFRLDFHSYSNTSQFSFCPSPPD